MNESLRTYSVEPAHVETEETLVMDREGDTAHAADASALLVWKGEEFSVPTSLLEDVGPSTCFH